MDLHIGGGDWVTLEELVCVLDAKDLAPDTKNLIDHYAKHGRVIPCEGRPKSYLITADARGEKTVHASPLGSETLRRRWKDACLHERIRDIALLTVDEAH